jgi:hypothetical protein
MGKSSGEIKSTIDKKNPVHDRDDVNRQFVHSQIAFAGYLMFSEFLDG